MRTLHRDSPTQAVTRSCGRYPDLTTLATHYIAELRRIYPSGSVRQTEAARQFAREGPALEGWRENPWLPPGIREKYRSCDQGFWIRIPCENVDAFLAHMRSKPSLGNNCDGSTELGFHLEGEHLYVGQLGFMVRRP